MLLNNLIGYQECISEHSCVLWERYKEKINVVQWFMFYVLSSATINQLAMGCAPNIDTNMGHYCTSGPTYDVLFGSRTFSFKNLEVTHVMT